MLSAWYVVVGGSDPDIAALGDLCASSTEHSLAEEQPGEWRLRSSTLASTADHEDAWPRLCELLVRLSDVAAAAVEDRLKLTPGTLGRTKLDGGSDVYVHPDTARGRLRSFPPTVTVSGTPTEPLPARLLRLQEADDHLRLALHFLNADLSWFSLWRAFEEVRHANAEDDLVTYEWTTRTQIRRFRNTANSYEAIGDAARHSHKVAPAPKKPMTLDEADEFVRRLLSRWVASLS